VAVARPVEDELLGQRSEGAHPLLSEIVGARGDGRLDEIELRSLAGRGRPALAVAADPLGGGQRLEPVEGLAGPRAEERVVAAKDEAVGAAALRVGQHGLEREQVAVDVVEEREHPAVRL
jgi:hypothetical protein